MTPIVVLISLIPSTMYYVDYDNFVYINRFPKLCSLADDVNKENRCYYETARNLKDAQSCSYIGSDTARDECFDIFSRAEEIKESCLFIKDLERRNGCVEDVEWLQNDSL